MPVERWAVQWRSKNRLNGEAKHFMWNGTTPHLFATRREARAWIEREYGYIRSRPDLRSEPHGWRMPKSVKVEVVLRGGADAKT